MIIDSQKLKTILDLILVNTNFPSLNLEISKPNEDNLIIAVNYSDLYYISCTIDITNEQELDHVDRIVIPKNGVEKLHQLTVLWPKSIIKIIEANGLISFEVIGHGQLVRERPVYVECFFQQVINEYIIEPPSMSYNCTVNSKNLKQMLEFCDCVDGGIYLEIRNKSLSISSTQSSLATLVELEELKKQPSKKIKLSSDANNLVISFLNKLVNKFNLVYLIFTEHETAFSVRVDFDNFKFQIYTMHE